MKRTHATPELELGHRLASMSRAEVARAVGCTPGNLCDMLVGRRPLSSRILDWLGFERVTIVRPKQ